MSNQIIQIKDGSDNVFSKENIEFGTAVTSYMTSQREDFINQLIKVNHVVFVMLGVTFTNPITTGYIFQLPSGFRPSEIVKVPCIAVNGAGTRSSYFLEIYTDGTVRQRISSSLKEVMMFGEFIVA